MRSCFFLVQGFTVDHGAWFSLSSSAEADVPRLALQALLSAAHLRRAQLPLRRTRRAQSRHMARCLQVLARQAPRPGRCEKRLSTVRRPRDVGCEARASIARVSAAAMLRHGANASLLLLIEFVPLLIHTHFVTSHPLCIFPPAPRNYDVFNFCFQNCCSRAEAVGCLCLSLIRRQYRFVCIALELGRAATEWTDASDLACLHACTW